jgi:hypothetical protein
LTFDNKFKFILKGTKIYFDKNPGKYTKFLTGLFTYFSRREDRLSVSWVRCYCPPFRSCRSIRCDLSHLSAEKRVGTRQYVVAHRFIVVVSSCFSVCVPPVHFLGARLLSAIPWLLFYIVFVCLC